VGVLVRRSFFFAFVRFSGGFDPPSARAGAVETYFSMFEPALQKVRFFCEFREDFWYLWLQNSIKSGLKLDLEHKNTKSMHF